MSAEQEVMSKSAKKRAAQKARDAGAAAEAAPAAPAAPAPKGKAKAEPKKAEPKADAKAKATPKKQEEAAPKAAGKAKAAPKEAAGKAKAAPKVAAAPAAEAPKAEAKSKAKAKAKKAKEEAPPPAPKEEVPDWVQLDDGTGGDWEEASGLNKKQEAAQRRKAAKEEAAKAEAVAAAKAAKDAEINAAKAAKAASKKGGGSSNAEILAKMDADMAVAKLARAQAKAGASAVASAKGEGKGQPEKEPEVDDGSISVTLAIPQGKIGRIIGPKGANITFIKEKTGVKTIDTQGEVCVIIGQPEDVPKAEMAIRELIEKGYMSISYENFKADQITVPSTAIPNIIGKGGCIIQVIKKELQVEVDVEATPKQADNAKRVVTKVKVSIVGELENVEKAKECIQSIAEFSHHEITHPGYTHEELAVEDWKYRFLIGPGGSEMRHIQNSWHVQVNIPRDGGEDAKVLVVGEAIAVEKAVKYINTILEKADQPQGRDKPEEKKDVWDKDDGPSEPWMDAYMYKRK